MSMHDELVKFILIQSFQTLNALRFKCFEVLEKISDFERFTQIKEFSKLSETFRKEFTVLVYLMTEPTLKNVLKVSEFHFRDWGKNPSQLDTLELTDRDTLCTGRFRTRGMAIRNSPRSQSRARQQHRPALLDPRVPRLGPGRQH